jgi:hypothetical protein
MTVRKRRTTVKWKRKQQISHYGEITLEKAVNLWQGRQQNKGLRIVLVIHIVIML